MKDSLLIMNWIDTHSGRHYKRSATEKSSRIEKHTNIIQIETETIPFQVNSTPSSCKFDNCDSKFSKPSSIKLGTKFNDNDYHDKLETGSTQISLKLIPFYKILNKNDSL